MRVGVAQVGDQITTNVGGKTMKAISKWTIVSALLAGAAYAQVPSTNDTSDGNDNTGMGTGALGGPNPVNLTGNFNTAAGFQALFANTTGDKNTASGAEALAENTAGSDNTASGYEALGLNTTGNFNTAAGAFALVNNKSGYE